MRVVTRNMISSTAAAIMQNPLQTLLRRRLHTLPRVTDTHCHPGTPATRAGVSGCNLVKYSPCPLLVSEFKAPEDDTYDRPESPRSVSFLGELRQKSHNDLENIKVMNFVSNLRLKKVNVKEIWINNRNKYLFSLACWCQSGQYKV